MGLLVLSRHKSEQLRFKIPPCAEERELVVVVTEIRGDKVRLGIDAPRDIVVWRAELGEFKKTADSAA